LGQNLVKDILKHELEGLGYNLLDVQVLNAADFGVPQRRNRVVFLAYRNDVAPLKYPKPTNKRGSVYDVLGDLYNGQTYYTEYYRESIIRKNSSYKTGHHMKRKQNTNMKVPNK